MLPLLCRQRNWNDLWITTTVSETKSRSNQLFGSSGSVTPLSRICEIENSTCCLKWAPKNDESTNCILMNLVIPGVPGGTKGREKPFQRWFGAQAGWSGFLQWFEGDKGWLQAQLGCLKVRERDPVYSGFLCSSPLQIHVFLTGMAWFSCPVLPSDDCDFLWTFILRLPWIATFFF